MSRLEEIVYGAMFYAGVALLVVAAWKVAPQLGLAVLGVVLVVGAVLAGGRSAGL